MSGKRGYEETSESNDHDGQKRAKRFDDDELDDIENLDKRAAITNEEYRKTWPRAPMKSPIDPTRDTLGMLIFSLLRCPFSYDL